ncbi:hypothetical protein BJ742DRAFT_773349 [Cladochytrium replicatum]|nr:hypothetical protein BJ742DRAFT_773349 [Cladochytrium replicatum]
MVLMISPILLVALLLSTIQKARSAPTPPEEFSTQPQPPLTLLPPQLRSPLYLLDFHSLRSGSLQYYHHAESGSKSNKENSKPGKSHLRPRQDGGPQPFVSIRTVGQFELHFTCVPQKSANAANAPEGRNGADCPRAESTMIRALDRLSRTIILRTTVVINATFESFCSANGGYWVSDDRAATQTSGPIFNVLKAQPESEDSFSKWLRGLFGWTSSQMPQPQKKAIESADDGETGSKVVCSVDSASEILGSAAPASWHLWNSDEIEKLRATYKRALKKRKNGGSNGDLGELAMQIDPAYVYPSALAKQFAPDLDMASSSPVPTGAKSAGVAAEATTSPTPTGSDTSPTKTTLFDISAHFNADFGWWFPSPDDTYGDGFGVPFIFNNGPSNDAGNTTPGGDQAPPWNTIRNGRPAFDFEQVVLHEMIHGLGFMSSWYPWTAEPVINITTPSGKQIPAPTPLLPSWLQTNGSGVITGIGVPFLFNKWMSVSVPPDALTAINDQFFLDSCCVPNAQSAPWTTFSSRKRSVSIWMSAIEKLIRTEAARVAGFDLQGQPLADPDFQHISDTTKWYTRFTNTSTYQWAVAAMKLGATNPNGGIFGWYPIGNFSTTEQGVPPQDPFALGLGLSDDQDTQSPTLRFAALYTPEKFAGGSSLSHVSAAAYDGTTEFLMRPFSTAGIGLSGYEPVGRLGPMGDAVLGILRGMGYDCAVDRF